MTTCDLNVSSIVLFYLGIDDIKEMPKNRSAACQLYERCLSRNFFPIVVADNFYVILLDEVFSFLRSGDVPISRERQHIRADTYFVYYLLSEYVDLTLRFVIVQRSRRLRATAGLVMMTGSDLDGAL